MCSAVFFETERVFIIICYEILTIAKFTSAFVFSVMSFLCTLCTNACAHQYVFAEYPIPFLLLALLL